MASSPMSTINSSGVDRSVPAAAPKPLTVDQLGVQYLLGALNNPGTYQPGTAGYTVSNAGARGAETAAGNAAQAGLDNAYGQAVSSVQARNPLIQQSADQADATMASDTNGRLSGIQSAADARTAAQQAAARAMGLAWTPQVSGASQQGDLLGKQITANTGAWKGLNDSNAQTNISRNNGIADSFNYELGQSKTKLAQAVASALANLRDTYVSGRAGRYVGATSAAQNLQIAKALISQGNTQSKEKAAAQKAKAGSVSTTTTKNSNGSTSSSKTVRK